MASEFAPVSSPEELNEQAVVFQAEEFEPEEPVVDEVA